MLTSKISVIALLMITGIYFGKFVCPYIKKKKGLWQSVLFILRLCLFYIWFRHRLIIFRISDWNYSSVSCNVCRGQKKYISENISCNYVLFYPMVNGCNGRQTWWFVTKALVFRNMSAEKCGCNTDYMLEPEFGYCTLYCFYCGCNRTDQ